MDMVVKIQDINRRDGVMNMGRYNDILTGLGEIEMLYSLDMDAKDDIMRNGVLTCHRQKL